MCERDGETREMSAYNHLSELGYSPSSNSSARDLHLMRWWTEYLTSNEVDLYSPALSRLILWGGRIRKERKCGGDDDSCGQDGDVKSEQGTSAFEELAPGTTETP